jgi:hypothetical protein
MKKYILFFVSTLFICTSLFAQKEYKDSVKVKTKTKSKAYFVFEETWNFQYGMIQDNNGHKANSIVRFAPIGNMSLQLNKDFGNAFGIFTGIGTKNLGFITKNDTSGEKVKSRAYCLSIPVGLKFGNMKKEKYFYLQGEFLWQFDYKEKVFSGGEKTKRKNFYNPGINAINWSSTAGFNYKGFTFGVEYTLTNFFSNNYRFQDVKSNAMVYPTIEKSQIVTFFIGFRADLRSEKTATAPPKQLQQARLNQY